MLARHSRRAPPSWSSPPWPLIAVVFLHVAVCAASSCRRLCRGRRARRAWKSRVTGPAGRERRCACGSLCTVPRLTAIAYFEGTKSGPVRRDAGRIRAEFLGLHSDAARRLRNGSLSARRRRWGRWPLSRASGLPRTAIAPVAVASHAQLRGASAVAPLRIRRARMRTSRSKGHQPSAPRRCARDNGAVRVQFFSPADNQARSERFRRCKVAPPEQQKSCSGRATLHLRNVQVPKVQGCTSGTRFLLFRTCNLAPSEQPLLMPFSPSSPLAPVSPRPVLPFAQFQPPRPLLLSPLARLPSRGSGAAFSPTSPFPQPRRLPPRPRRPRAPAPALQQARAHAGDQPSSPRALLGRGCRINWRIRATGPSRFASRPSGASTLTSSASTLTIGGARASFLTTSTR